MRRLELVFELILGDFLKLFSDLKFFFKFVVVMMFLYFLYLILNLESCNIMFCEICYIVIDLF